MAEVRLWFPTGEEKEKVVELCNKCIDILSELPRVEQKAFALAELVNSFEDVSGIKFDAIFTAYNQESGK